MKYQDAEKMYKALANKRRLEILHYLSKETKANVIDISEKIKLSYRSTSKHLQILKNAGFIDSDQIDFGQFYYLKDKNNSFVKHFLSIF
ncbi:ArsR family transcriptional regulator [Patescibacteria group bacterium]|nr:ArsR family transcriptional regulator [Patescibacteria group bacterium]MBU4057525.1 ArsR family transcriptional regulator [Patescibacteria group bacterium]MBU4116101.1 ArsR family transcriptional regulator [Patescibacteria group bacterium]